MKATIRDSEVLHSIRPLDVVGYLRSKGWREAERLTGGAFWVKEIASHGYEILVPLDARLRDFTARMAEALLVLETVEERSQIEIVEDLSILNADVIRPRLPGTQGDGTITLEQGKTLHAEARDMMLAAACATIGRRSVFAPRKPEQAMEYLNRARFGLARRGSYIMTIISPVAPRLTEETDLFGAVEQSDPFERATVKLLARGLEAINRACREIAANGGVEPMRAAVADGVSANLCEAIVGLHNGSGASGIDFCFAWSPARGAPAGINASVAILPDAIPIIAETARVFRETETFENTEVVGTVQRLQHMAGQQGDVTIFGLAEGQQRTVHIELTGAEHSLAINAYDSRAPVSCRGRLVKEGRSWVLKDPREFRVLDSLI